MRKALQSSLVALGILLLLFQFESPLAGLTLKATNWSELNANADCVIAATVRSLISEQTDEPHCHGILTRMRLGDVSTLGQSKAPAIAPAEYLDVILPGGVLDGQRVLVPGAPSFKSNQQVVLFLRESGNKNEFFLLGHGLGVMRRSEDGAWISPDVPVKDGPPAAGEDYSHFVQRFNAPMGAMLPERRAEKSALAVTVEDSDFHVFIKRAAVLGAVALLLAGVVLLRRKHDKTALVVLVGLGLAVEGAVYLVRGANPSHTTGIVSRDFKLEGASWNLNSELRGRVHQRRVLWLQGKGSRSLRDSDAFNTIQQQFQQWEDIPESAIAFSKNGQSIDAGSSIDEQNTISFLVDPPRPLFDKFTLAVTFTLPDLNNNFIDADTVFNDNLQWVIGQGDDALEVVALHEIGHFLGLAHSSDPADVMFPIAGGLRVLSPGDRAGAAFLYPVTNQAVAFASASPESGPAPLTVSFSSDGSSSNGNPAPAGMPLTLSWDFGDGTATGITTNGNPLVQHTYTAPGNFTATLAVFDGQGGSATATVPITVANAAGSTGMSASKFNFQAALAVPVRARRGSDRFNLVLSGIDLRAADIVTLNLGGNPIGANPDGSTVLDAKTSYKGASTFDGKLDMRFDAKKNALNVKLSAATLIRALDPRTPPSLAQSGSASFDINALVQRGTNTVFYSTSVDFTFRINAGRSRNGFLENSIHGKQ